MVIGAPAGGSVEAEVGGHEYRAPLDGVRAVAVYLVVLFHAGVPSFVGGFIGVDVFFVLSGYLVTQVLLRDVEALGSIRFGRFYSRRIRRLLPAAAATLLVTAAVYSALASPAAVAAAADGVRASFLYYANWFFVGEATDYFAEDINRSPVLHFWSLAVEEQFYLLWPLLFGGLWALTGRVGAARARVLPAVVGVAAVVSASWALLLRGDQPTRAYFGTDARAYQLLVGALIALLPGLVSAGGRRRVQGLAAPAGVVSVLVLGTSLLDLDPIVRGVAVAVAAAAFIVGVEARQGGWVARAVAVGPVVYLGRISYGTYLWHWPVIVVARELGATPGPMALAGITALVATGLAALSYQLVEMPVRVSRPLGRHRIAVIGVGLATSVVSALVLIPVLTDRTSSDAVAARAPAPTEGFTPIPASFDYGTTYFEYFGGTVDCVDQAPEGCTVYEGTGRHVLLMGDSNAMMLVPAFTELARSQDLRLSLAVTAGCPWQRDIFRFTEEFQAECRRTKPDAYDRVIPALDPDLIVLADLRRPESLGEFDGSDRQTRLRDATEASLDELSQGDRDLVIIKPMPGPVDDRDPLECLDQATFVEECRFVVPAQPSWLDTMEQQIAERSERITFLDLDRLVCPFLPICDPLIGEIPVYWNEDHITTRYSQTLAEPISDRLRELGLI